MKSVFSQQFLQVLRVAKQARPSSRVLSSQPESLKKEDIAFRTLEDDPAKHTKAHIGLYYSVPQEIAHQRLFQFGGFPKPFNQQCKTFNETCLMIRKPALELIHYLKTADYQNPINKYVVYGKPGVGKSISLSHVLHFVALNDWLLVHVPWVNEWMRQSRIEVVNSTTRPGYVDMPTKAAAWLIHFKAQNAALINKLDLRLQNEYVWNKREVSKVGDTFSQLIDHGVSRTKYASEVVVALLSEIKAQSKQDKFRTLIAIDGYNAFFHPETLIIGEEKKIFPPWQVSFIQEFLNLTNSDWNNGAAILVCDEMAVPWHDASPLPLYQLKKKGFEHLDPFIPVEVPNFTEKEMYSMLYYYKERLWLQNVKGMDELVFLCGGNGYRLMQLCAPL